MNADEWLDKYGLKRFSDSRERQPASWEKARSTEKGVMSQAHHPG
jgi:hypothetical protein